MTNDHQNNAPTTGSGSNGNRPAAATARRQVLGSLSSDVPLTTSAARRHDNSINVGTTVCTAAQDRHQRLIRLINEALHILDHAGPDVDGGDDFFSS
jgi:hypothetical protein